MVGFTGTAAFSTPSLTMITFLQNTFMQQGKVNFLHFAMNDLKVTHSARSPGGWRASPCSSRWAP